MQQRIADLERKLKTTTAITVVLAILLVGVAVLTQIPLRTPQSIFVGDRNAAHARISTNGIYLVAADGRARAAMDITDTGPRMALFDEKGSEGATLRLNADGVSLGLKSNSGAVVFLSAEQTAALMVDAGGGRAKLAVEASAGQTKMSLDGGQGGPVVQLNAGATGASVTASNPKVPATAALFTAGDASGLALGRADSPGKLSTDKTSAAALFSVNASGAPALELRRAGGARKVIVPPAQ